MQLLTLLDVAQRRAGEVIALTHRDQYALPTPCAGWSVAQLVNKMITSAALWTRLVAETAAVARDASMLHPTEVKETDPAASYSEAATACIAAFRASGVEGDMPDPMGTTVSRTTGLLMRSLDATINTWDLAMAIGVPHGISDAQAEPLLDFAQVHVPAMRSRLDHQRFGDALDIMSTQPLDVLLACSGRSPDWIP